jgi:nitrous oxidase accessory protein NosD
MKNRVIVSILLLMSYYMAFATSIDVSGNISTNTTWEPDTVFVVGNVTVDDGSKLTIQPGVTVVANGFYSLNIQGTILAEGTEGDSILFTAADHVIGWDRILFDSTPATNDSSKFSYCIVEYGNSTSNGGAFYIYYSRNLTISNSTIRHNNGTNAAIYMDQSSCNILNCDIYSNNSYAIFTAGTTSDVNIINNKIHDGIGAGIYTYRCSADIVGNLIYNNAGSGIAFYESTSKIVNNTIVGNNLGGLVFISASNNDLYNNIIYGNIDNQIAINNVNSDPNFYNCDIEGGEAGFTGTGSGAEFSGNYSSCIDTDPNFLEDEFSPYSIPKLSPCQDKGRISITDFEFPFEDVVGNQRVSNDLIDIGAYEYYIRTDTVSGVWTKALSPYLITGNVLIADGTTLTIEPGVEVIFQDHFKFDVKGTILAEGTESDSILFTAADHEVGWNRILFNSTPATNDSSKFSYCIIEYGNSPDNGGAFYIYYSRNLTISNSTIRHNNGTNAAIYMDQSSCNILNCDIYSNNSYAIFTAGTTSDVNIINNKIHDGIGAGIYTYRCSADIVGNLIYNNAGSGIAFYESTSKIVNNTIVGNNLGGLVFISASNNDLYNNIIYSNNTNQIAINNVNSDPNFFNCDIEGGDAGFSGAGSGAEYTGFYENCIDSIPLFVDNENDDYRLLTSSPCIDTGDSTIANFEFPINDIEGNSRILAGEESGSIIIDMGAYEYDPNSTSIDPDLSGIIESYTLSQNYPNPFNPETTISYSLINNAQVNLKVYDIAGREIYSLVDQKQNMGSHEIKFDGSMLTSGLYFYRLSVDGNIVSKKKMMLLK